MRTERVIPFVGKLFQMLCLAPMLATLSAQVAKPLPRVLIAGDQFYVNLSNAVAKELKNEAQVIRKHPGSTAMALEKFDECFGGAKWDVIYFNFGFADLVHRDPQTKAVRLMSRYVGGVRMTSPEKYEKNLQEIVKRMKATGAKLIWASTTPITGSDQHYVLGSEVEFNQIATRIMAQNNIPVLDLHAIAQKAPQSRPGREPPGYVDPLQTAMVEMIGKAL